MSNRKNKPAIDTFALMCVALCLMGVGLQGGNGGHRLVPVVAPATRAIRTVPPAKPHRAEALHVGLNPSRRAEIDSSKLSAYRSQHASKNAAAESTKTE
jgi:hypothetical protein